MAEITAKECIIRFGIERIGPPSASCLSPNDSVLPGARRCFVFRSLRFRSGLIQRGSPGKTRVDANTVAVPFGKLLPGYVVSAVARSFALPLLLQRETFRPRRKTVSSRKDRDRYTVSCDVCSTLVRVRTSNQRFRGFVRIQRVEDKRRNYTGCPVHGGTTNFRFGDARV